MKILLHISLVPGLFYFAFITNASLVLGSSSAINTSQVPELTINKSYKREPAENEKKGSIDDDYDDYADGGEASLNKLCSISDAYDGGNIEYMRTDGNTVYLKIKSDPFTQLEKKSHKQYFSFRCTFPPTSTTLVTFAIENAKNCSYPAAWPGTTVFASTNFRSWRRILSTKYETKTGQLVWSFNSGSAPIVYFSYFPPYSYEHHLILISKCASMKAANIKSLGKTLDGREIDCVTIGTGRRIAWIIHREHPGETMSEFFAEGLLFRLLLGTKSAEDNDKDTSSMEDSLAKIALEMFTFHIVPNMNPDGSVKGQLRTNSCGANLNREWSSSGNYTAPTLERSPEVFHVLNEMIKTGVDAFIDVHGDEDLPFNFIVGNEELVNWDGRLKALHGAFVGAYTRANSDMQKEVAYPPPSKQKKINLAIASRQIAHRFDCLSVTLEMPFKDCLSNPEPMRGWNPERASKLGASLLDALVYVQPYLRAEGVSTETFPSKDDAYVRPTNKYQKYYNTSSKGTHS